LIWSVMSPEFRYRASWNGGAPSRAAWLRSGGALVVEHEVVPALRSIRRNRDAGIGAIDRREVTHSTAAVGKGICGTQDRVAVVARIEWKSPFCAVGR
jgi:hypothetical protein